MFLFSHNVHQQRVTVPSVRRLAAITGYKQRVNDVLLVSNNFNLYKGSSLVVVFGGDVQDYPENMLDHRDHGAYISYNLESMATQMATHFPHNAIAVIRPSRMELKTFSCYDNFVLSNNVGSPTYQANNQSLLHLAALLRAIPIRAQNKILDFQNCPIMIIGFSKGCVVLNQFIHEFHHFTTNPPESEEIPSIISRIKHMIWLDGGHSGSTGTWVTSRSILSSLAEKGIKVDVHVTPYQVQDDRRPWIAQEERLFCTILKKLGVEIKRTLHYAEQPPTLENHFKLLTIFPLD